jgi:hypothetical protein
MATGYGTSAFHEPVPKARTSTLGGSRDRRIHVSGRAHRVTLRRADPEAGWWLGALAAYAPVSQILPFTFGMGDRHLYFTLPG